MRLEWEVQPLGVLLDGTAASSGPLVDTGAPVPGRGSAIPLEQEITALAAATPYHWRVRTVSTSPFFPRSPWLSIQGNGRQETDLRTSEVGSAVNETPTALISGVSFAAVWPNPVSQRARFAWSLPRDGHVRLAVVDVLGREVVLLVNGPQKMGAHSVDWNRCSLNGAPLPKGIYFARLEALGGVQTRKLILAR